MFGWFRPTCPVDVATKRWIEERLNWLAREFPTNVFTEKPLILPTAEFFPMSRVNDAFEHLHAGKARYRIILENDLTKA